jgi:hypothetical protein
MVGLPMAARNIFHDAVVCALTSDGWTITHDPLRLSFGGEELFVDLGAEQVTVAAEKADRKIAVEIQSFRSPSPVRDLEESVGQYEIYRAILRVRRPERRLYPAVPFPVYDSLFTERFGQFVVSELQLRLLVFDDQEKRILQWIESSDIA